MSEIINYGWLTNFEDKKFAPKSLFDYIYTSTTDGRNLTAYFSDFKSELDNRVLQVNLASDSSVKFSSPGAIGVTGILDVPNGGTGTATAPTQWGVIYASSTSAYASTAAPTAAGQFLMSQSSKKPVWHTPTVTLTGDVTTLTTSFNTSGNISITTDIADSGVTAGSYGPSGNVSPAHGGTFTIPYITVAADGRITSASTKTITLPRDSNTDTKVTQRESTTSANYPVLLKASTGTASITSTTIFSSQILANPYNGSFSVTTLTAKNQIKLSPSGSAGHGGYIDFHFNGNTADYTTRLYESAKGTLSLVGALNVSGVTTLNNKIILSSNSFGTSLPSSGTEGQIFFVLVD